uniref:Ventrally expressed dharma/bozozok antagonist n=1 Tax=Oryzias sinensis TaxID=183150 RepID=A0A8C7WTK4_9TELE
MKLIETAMGGMLSNINKIKVNQTGKFFFLSSVCFRPEGSVCVALSCEFHMFLLLSGPEADLSAEEETSGYESEGSRPRSPSAHAKPAPSLPASPPAGRRPRTAFTAEQIDVLERAFKKNAYLGTQDKAELCRKLRLSDKQIRNWFQNRRMKLKRSVQDALAHACQASAASQFLHRPELQAYRPGPYARLPPADAAPFSPPTSLHYGCPLTSTSALSLDSFYQLNGLPGVLLPPASAHLWGSYPTYPPYY